MVSRPHPAGGVVCGILGVLHLGFCSGCHDYRIGELSPRNSEADVAEVSKRHDDSESLSERRLSAG